MTIMFVLIYLCLAVFFTYGFYQSAVDFTIWQCITIGIFWPVVILVGIVCACGIWVGDLFGNDEDNDHDEVVR